MEDRNPDQSPSGEDDAMRPSEAEGQPPERTEERPLAGDEAAIDIRKRIREQASEVRESLRVGPTEGAPSPKDPPGQLGTSQMRVTEDAREEQEREAEENRSDANWDLPEPPPERRA